MSSCCNLYAPFPTYWVCCSVLQCVAMCCSMMVRFQRHVGLVLEYLIAVYKCINASSYALHSKAPRAIYAQKSDTPTWHVETRHCTPHMNMSWHAYACVIRHRCHTRNACWGDPMMKISSWVEDTHMGARKDLLIHAALLTCAWRIMKELQQMLRCAAHLHTHTYTHTHTI